MRTSIKQSTTDEFDLNQFNLFNNLTEQEMTLLNSHATCSMYQKRSVIYKEGSRLTGFYCINSGIVKQYKTGIDGREQIFCFLKKGDIIAYRSLLSQEMACTTAQAMEDSELIHIPYQSLLYLIQNNWQFSYHLLQIACRELRRANDYIADITQKTLRERLAEVLLLLKDNFDLDSSQILQISLTRKELANMVGTAPESIIRILSEFKQSKLVELQGSKIKFMNIPELTKIANLL